MIKDLELNKYEIRIQGESGDFYRSREVSHFINILEKGSYKSIPEDEFLNWFVKKKEALFNNKRAWGKFNLNVLHAIVFEFDKIKTSESTYRDLLSHIEDFSRKDDGQLFQVYEANKRALNLPIRKEIILTTMHRVKGLEFDAVMVLPSIATIREPDSDDPENEFSDLLDEEIRLLYVAYSRAKKYLSIYNGPRKSALLERAPYEFTQNHLLGQKIESGIDKYIFFTLANTNVQKILINDAKIGDPISLGLSTNGNWTVRRNGNLLGTLSTRNIKKRKELQFVPAGINSLNGYYLTGLIQHTVEESRKYDAENDTKFTKRWDEELINQGWILIPDFAGYGK